MLLILHVLYLDFSHLFAKSTLSVMEIMEYFEDITLPFTQGCFNKRKSGFIHSSGQPSSPIPLLGNSVSVICNLVLHRSVLPFCLLSTRPPLIVKVYAYTFISSWSLRLQADCTVKLSQGQGRESRASSDNQISSSSFFFNMYVAMLQCCKSFVKKKPILNSPDG